MEAKKLVGWNIRRLRVERVLTIEELAAEADVAPAYLGQVERGAVNVGVVVLGRVAKVLGARLGELFVEPLPGAKPPKPLKAGRRLVKPRKPRS
jgi:transcriptional regulator with XRE-family HTH domain